MNPLRELVERFHDLAESSPPMTITALAYACDPLLNMINLMGPASTESWGKEITAKVRTLRSASNQMNTLEELIVRDSAYNCVGSRDTNSHVLVLLRRSIKALKVLAGELLKGRHVTLQAAAHKAYTDVFQKHHDSATSSSANKAFSGFPSREWVTGILGETADGVDKLLRTYVTDSARVINYIDTIFVERGHGEQIDR